jgi:hypothetical protein
MNKRIRFGFTLSKSPAFGKNSIALQQKEAPLYARLSHAK